LKLLTGSIGVLTLTQIPNLIGGFSGLIGPISGAAAALGPWALAIASFGSAYLFGAALYAHPQTWKAIGDAIGEAVFRLTHWGQTTETVTKAQAEQIKTLEDTRAKVAQIVSGLLDMPDEKETQIFIKGTPEYEAELKRIQDQIAAVPETKTTEVKAKTEDFRKQVGEIKVLVDEELGTELIVPVYTKADSTSLDDAKKKIDEKIPEQKLLEIKLQGEIDIEIEKIRAQAETLQAAFEWKAKIDLAEIEAQVQKIEILSGNITRMFENSGEVLVGFASSLADLSGYESFKVIEAIEAESKRRDELLALQKELTQAEIDLTRARAERLEKGGGGLIEISASGVYPELEIVLQKIIERAQIQSNAEGLELLLGA